MTVATLAAFVWALRGDEADLRRPMTIAFMTLALTQLLHVFNARSSRSIAFGSQIGKNRWIWRAWVLTVLLQLAAIYLPPLAAVLQTTPLGARDWALVAVASAVPLVVGQVAKARSGLHSSPPALRHVKTLILRYPPFGEVPPEPEKKADQ